MNLHFNNIFKLSNAFSNYTIYRGGSSKNIVAHLRNLDNSRFGISSAPLNYFEPLSRTRHLFLLLHTDVQWILFGRGNRKDPDKTTCDRLAIFSGSSGFLHQQNWPPRYNWNIVESGVKHQTTFIEHSSIGHRHCRLQLMLNAKLVSGQQTLKWTRKKQTLFNQSAQLYNTVEAKSNSIDVLWSKHMLTNGTDENTDKAISCQVE